MFVRHELKFFFSVCTAVRNLVFTVPSGSPVFAAISVCVNPSKYASSTAALCSCGNFSRAPRTFPIICVCATLDSRFAGITTVFSSSSSPLAGLCRRSPPELIKDVLQNFFSRLRVVKNPVQDGRQHPGVAVIQHRQCRLVPFDNSLDERRVRGSRIHSGCHVHEALKLQ